MNKVQFQKGLKMADFLEKYGTEEQCEIAVEASRWPEGFVCPQCDQDSASFITGRTKPTNATAATLRPL